MSHRLYEYVVRVSHRLTEALDRRRAGDTGAMTTLEMVVLAVGIVAIASMFLGAFREAVSSRLDQLR